MRCVASACKPDREACQLQAAAAINAVAANDGCLIQAAVNLRCTHTETALDVCEATNIATTALFAAAVSKSGRKVCPPEEILLQPMLSEKS